MQISRYSSYSIYTKIEFDSIAKKYNYNKSSKDIELSYYKYLHELK